MDLSTEEIGQTVMRRTRIVVVWMLLLAVVGCRGVEPRPAPNVIVLFTDDQRYNTVGALGNDEISTPNIDDLVARGTAFTRAHIMGGQHGALCAPSRAMLLTGRPLFSLLDKGDVIPEAHVTMPQHFRAAGYRTFGTGKWHNNRQAFNRSFEDGDNIFFGGMHWPADGGHERPMLHHYDSTGAYGADTRWQGDRYSSALFADAAVSFIKRYADEAASGNSGMNATDPFFVYVAFSSPHDPRTPPEPFAAAYTADSVSLPDNYAPEHPFDNGELYVRDEKLLPHPRTEEAVRKDIAAYYGMISEVDAQIGRIVDALEAAGLSDNTIIVFAGDNGLAVGSHGLLGKQNLYDHSMRVPLVLAGPGVNAGVQRDDLVYLFDLFPTLAESAGLDTPPTVEGRSIVSMLQGEGAGSSSAGRDAVFYVYKDVQRGVRTKDDWKLISYNVDGVQRHQLFDLRSDPHELENLYDSPKATSARTRLQSLLIEKSREFDDPLSLDKPDWGKPKPEPPNSVSHAGVGARVELATSFDSQYPGGGAAGLVDGIQCTADFRASCWHALRGEDLDVVVDLRKEQSVSSVGARFVRNLGAWIFLPERVSVEVAPRGGTFEQVGEMDLPVAAELDPAGVEFVEISFPSRLVDRVRFRAEGPGMCPAWHAGVGNPSWMFVDEVVVQLNDEG